MALSSTSWPYETLIMLRLCGEVTTKTRGVRQRFHRRLNQNIRDAFLRHGIKAKVRDQWYRIDVQTEDLRAVDVAKQIFGIQAVSLARSYAWQTLDDIVEIGEALFSTKVAGKTFAVRTRRAGFRDKIPFTSPEVDRTLGARLVAAGGEVDLKNHELRVGVEVREDRVLFFEEEHRGVSGLPGGVEGRALALMSGGFDSAVAAWSMMRRGVDLDFVFFNLAGPPQLRAVQEVTRTLCEKWAYGYSPKFYVVDLRPMIAQMRQEVDGRYWQILLKRLMFRAGELLSNEKDYPAMITGESCGQVSSQTLMSLAAITAPITTGVLRPLVAMNKEEIIERSRLVGTHDISAGVPEFCALDGGPPSVDARPRELDEAEAQLDLELLKELVARHDVMNALEMEPDHEADVQVEKVPAGAVVIDLRDERDFSNWTYEGAINMPFERALEQAGLLPKSAVYLLCCEVGLKSAFLAEAMQKMGYEAFSFRGGVRPLRRRK